MPANVEHTLAIFCQSCQTGLQWVEQNLEQITGTCTIEPGTGTIEMTAESMQQFENEVHCLFEKGDAIVQQFEDSGPLIFAGVNALFFKRVLRVFL